MEETRRIGVDAPVTTSVVGNLGVLSTKSVLKRAKNAARDWRRRF
jgi:hypothetical protein